MDVVGRSEAWHRFHPLRHRACTTHEAVRIPEAAAKLWREPALLCDDLEQARPHHPGAVL
jgi:hypothetical protein